MIRRAMIWLVFLPTMLVIGFMLWPMFMAAELVKEQKRQKQLDTPGTLIVLFFSASQVTWIAALAIGVKVYFFNFVNQ